MSTPKSRGQLKELVAAFAVLKTPKEINAFLNDLLSPHELVIFPQRWVIVRYLAQGLTYEQIQIKARVGSKKVGTATIVRAKRALDESGGGFKTALARTQRRGPRRASQT